MTHRAVVLVTLSALAVAACAPREAEQSATADSAATTAAASLAVPGEVHLRNIRQLTFGGENAEAYYAFDGTKLIYQARKPGKECDQIYIMDLATGESHMVSNGEGRTTCSYFYPKGDRILYSSTLGAGAACPPNPDFSKGYVWPIYPSYDIYEANVDGSDLHVADLRPRLRRRGHVLSGG